MCHYLHKNPQFTNDPELGEREIFNFRRDPRFPILLFSSLVFSFFFFSNYSSLFSKQSFAPCHSPKVYSTEKIFLFSFSTKSNSLRIFCCSYTINFLLQLTL